MSHVTERQENGSSTMQQQIVQLPAARVPSACLRSRPRRASLSVSYHVSEAVNLVC